ncbi:MAG: S8 family serine peptidase [Lachnospiraceae bacterium]|nr:S8 family serine peptidase [Lachnospiraceae bacterium]
MHNVKRKIAIALCLATSVTSVFSGNSFSYVTKASTAVEEVSLQTEDEITTENVVESLTGTLTGANQVENITYKVMDEKENVIAEGEAEIKGNTFSADDVKLREGDNKVIFTAEDKDGEVTTTEMNVNFDGGTLADTEEKNVKTDKETGVQYVNNRLVITFNPKSTEEERQDVIDSVDGKVVGQINAIKCYQVQVDNADLNELSALATEIRKNNKGVVVAASVDTMNKAQMYVPNDPYDDGEEWTESNPDGSNWGYEAIQAASAWEMSNEYVNPKTGILENTVSGVVDGGFQKDHQDLDHVSYYEYMSTEDTAEDHGTHCAGIVGATADNNKGIAGVCQSKKVLISTVDDDGHLPTANLLKGLSDAVVNGAKTVNYSIGHVYPTTEDAKTTAALIASLYVQGYDFIYVQAAGNSCYNAKYNGGFSAMNEKNVSSVAKEFEVSTDDILKRALTVAATMKSKNGFDLTTFSNWGEYIDIAAPGYMILSSVKNNEYGYMSGTSMAAPFVTGATALLWGMNPSLTGPQIHDIVCDKANSDVIITDRTGSSYPMLNLKKCVEKVYNQTLHIYGVNVGNGQVKYTVGNKVEMSISAPGAENYQFDVVDADDEADGYDDALVYTSGVTGYHKASWTADKAGNYNVYIYAEDKNGIRVHKKVAISVGESQKLKVASFAASNKDIAYNEQVVLTAEAQNGVAPYKYSFGINIKGHDYYAGESSQFSYTAKETFTKKNAALFKPSDLTYSKETEWGYPIDVFTESDIVGKAKLFVKIKDATGKVVRKNLSGVKISSPEITEINTNYASPQKTGTTIKVFPTIKYLNGTNYTVKYKVCEGTSQWYYSSYYAETDGTQDFDLEKGYCEWTPEKAGNYTIRFKIINSEEQTVADNSLVYQVVNASENRVMVLYNDTFNTQTHECNIHYRVGNGKWTTAPGKGMSWCYFSNDYNNYYMIDLGNADSATVCFNDGNGKWDNNGGKNYVVRKGVYGISSGKVVNRTPNETISISGFNCLDDYDKNGLRFHYNINNGVQPYNIKYYCVDSDGVVDSKSVYAKNSCSLDEVNDEIVTSTCGKYTLKIEVTDAIGNETVYSEPVEVKKPSVDFTFSVPSPQKTGTEIFIDGEIINLYREDRYSHVAYFILKDDNFVASFYDLTDDFTWKPLEPGNYTILAYFRDPYGDIGTEEKSYVITGESLVTASPVVTATPTVKPTATPTVKPTATPTNVPTATPTVRPMVYFDNSNANWPGAYAYVWNYSDGSDAKTIAGTKVSENVYAFDVDGDYANIIFKGYADNWNLQTEDLQMPKDANNCFKPNYGGNKPAGVWTKYEPDVTPAPTVKPTATPTNVPTVVPTQEPGNAVTIYYTKSNWSKAYIHYNVNGVWTNVPGVSMTASDRSEYYWMYTIDLGNTTSMKACFNNGNGSWDNNNSKNYTFTAGVYGITNGNVAVLSNTATPTVKPTATATVKPTNTPTEAPTATPTVTPTQTPDGNTVTVYYKRAANSNWNDAYAHYKVDGAWTQAPGVKMTKVSAGYWKITIDLGSSSEVKICFNNGSGTWDNNGSKDYFVYAGEYLVDQTTKKVTKLN